MNRVAKVLAALALLLPAATRAQDGAADAQDGAADVVRAYLSLLESWSDGTNPNAPRELAAFEVRFLGTEPSKAPSGRTVRCLVQLDELVEEGVSELGPEGLYPLTLFYLDVFLAHALSDPPGLTDRSRARYTSVLDRYASRSKPRSEARRRHSQMLVAMASRFASHSYVALIWMGRQAALDAVALEPKSFAALYWAAFLTEKLGRHREALELWRQLVYLHGEDPELLLRRGVNLERQGKTGAARADFEKVARGAGEDDWRILAYQELAQLDPEAGNPRAVAVLDEALAAFPDDFGLRLLAGFHGLPVDPVLPDDVPPSPRLRYETMRLGELAAADHEWAAEVESRLKGLSTTLAEIRRRVSKGETAEKAYRFCGAE